MRVPEPHSALSLVWQSLRREDCSLLFGFGPNRLGYRFLLPH